MKLVIAIALFIATGCEKSSSNELPPAPPTSDGVQLLTLGDEPRRVLRYHLLKGAHAPLEIAMELDLEIQPRPMKMPTIAMTLDLGVDDVLADGSAKLRTVIKEVALRDRAGATLDAATLAPMKDMLLGLTYESTLSPDGAMTKGQVTGGQSRMRNQVEDMTRAIEQVAMRLPVVPVGVGAKWSSKKTVQQNGITMTTVTTTQLTAIDGDRFEFTTQTTLSAPDQKTTQQGMALEIKDIGGSGGGKGSVDTATMVMHGELGSEFRGTVTAGGQTSPMRVVMKLTMK